MRVFVAGGSGAIGRRLVPQLVEQGHEVTATTRSPQKEELLWTLGATPVVLDGLDAVAVGEAVAKARPEVIIHEMTALSAPTDFKHFDQWLAQTNALRTKGTEHLLAAAKAAGTRRFIAQSYTEWARNRAGGPVQTEEDPLEPQPIPTQRESLAAIRFLEKAVMTAPLEGIALRYGSLYGPGASEGVVEMLRKRKFPIVGSGAGIFSWLQIDDAAAATVAAVDKGKPGIYYIVDDDPAPVAEWLPYLAEVVGAKKPMHVPAWLARFFVGEIGVRWMTEGRGASNAKAKRELGWRPVWASWRDGFRHALTGTPDTASRNPAREYQVAA